MKSLKELGERYELELDKIVQTIDKDNPKSVLIQLPDGLKVHATQIVDEIKNKLKNKETSVKIWLGTCFGACDTPNTNSDLLIQFGHSPWK
jgi:2-(3-amino-3-carboxypropyl)histidine synthase